MKRKRIVSAMLIMTMITTTCSTNVFAGGDMSIVSINCEGVFKGCCKGEQDNNNKSNKPDKEDNKGSLHYQFDKETGHLTLLGSYIGTGPIAPQYTNNIRSVTIERGVRRLIGTFQNCYNLTSVYISDTVKEIGENAFADCKELESIKIPASVTQIGEDAFKGCTSLKRVTISSSSTEIDENAFEDCPANIISPKPSLNPMTITPPNVTSPGVSYSGINDSVGQTPITLPPNIVVSNPTNNMIPIIPNQIQVPIPLDVKQNTDSHNSSKVSIPDDTSNKSIEHSESSEEVSYTSNTETTVEPDKTTFKDGRWFVGKEIENKKITDIVSIPKDEIKYVTIRDGVKSIGEDAFSDCKGLKQIIIPNSVTSIGWHAFFGCTGLTSINVDEGNPEYKSVDGVLFSKDGTELIQYPASKKETNYFIPSSVTYIASCAFYGCAGLQEVTVRNSVKKIGWNAFGSCENLTSINVNIRNKYYEDIDGVIFLKDGTQLIQCPAGKQATNYIIPNSVTEIVEFAFIACTSLKEITIPDSVTDIASCAFYGCMGLTSINVGKGNQYFKSIDGVLFSKDGKKLIQYPVSKNATNYTVPNSVTSIVEVAFFVCTGLTSVDIPDSVISIGKSAFYGCTGLTSVDIPDSVISIGKSAFYGCTDLKEVTVPYSVTSIMKSAFDEHVKINRI